MFNKGKVMSRCPECRSSGSCLDGCGEDVFEQAENILELEDKVAGLESKLSQSVEREGKLRECVEFINNTAPAMYQYNDVEMRMVTKARQCLKQITEQKESDERND